MDFFSKTITVFKDNTLKLQIWDSAGQERYKSLIPSYVRGASIIFILYDLSSKTNKLNFYVNGSGSGLVQFSVKYNVKKEVKTEQDFDLKISFKNKQLEVHTK